MRASDRGFTFVELMMYSLILIVVMAIAGSLFMRLIVTQRDVIDIAEANNVSQLTFKELERDIRNASWARIASGGEVLVLQSRLATGTDFSSYRCIGYYMDIANGELRRTQGLNNSETNAILGATTSTARATVSSDWSPIRRGFTPIDGNRVFGVVDGLVTQPEAIRVRMAMATGNGHRDITFDKSVSLRPQRDLGTPQCA